MQGDPRATIESRQIGLRSIAAITDDRQAATRKLDSELMAPAGGRTQLDGQPASMAIEDFVGDVGSLSAS